MSETIKYTPTGIDINPPESQKGPEKIENIEISFNKDSVEINFHNLDLNVNNPNSPEIIITFEKQPITLEVGKTYGLHNVCFDKETPKMLEIAKEAETLLQIPENERPRKVMELLRKHLEFAYDDKVETLSKTEPERAKWVKENIQGLVYNFPLSEIFEKEFGLCRHLSIAYLWLAQYAGLEGVEMKNHEKIINIQRTDNGEKLFKMAEVGQPAPEHSWVEIKTSDGKWIPVDPSTKLVGDTKEGTEMFKKANYLGIFFGADWKAEPNELAFNIPNVPFFSPGESKKETQCRLTLSSTKSRISGMKKIPPTNIPYLGEGKLIINTTDRDGVMNLRIVDVKKQI